MKRTAAFKDGATFYLKTPGVSWQANDQEVFSNIFFALHGEKEIRKSFPNHILDDNLLLYFKEYKEGMDFAITKNTKERILKTLPENSRELILKFYYQKWA